MTGQNLIPLKNDGNTIKMHCHDDFQRRRVNPKKQQPIQQSNSVAVTIEWENFD